MASNALPPATNGGNASIKRQGHTTNGDFGSDVNATTKGRGQTKDLVPPKAN